MSEKKKQEKEDEKWDTDRMVYPKIMSLKVKVLLKIFLYSVVGPILLYCLFFSFLHYKESLITVRTKVIEIEEKRPLYWIYARNNDTGYLKHVHAVLERLGFKRSDNDTNWDLLWAHDYPFRALSSSLSKLEAHRRVNHFPGCGYITNKVDLSTTEGLYILPAFKLPEQRQEFSRYTNDHPDKIFVEKSNDHRGIRVKTTSNINVTAEGSFVQEFIQRPFLVDGHKFDIGIYTVITSIDPLRVYAYKGDVLFRFCPIKYYPFDPDILDKYVVGDDYLPIWNIPSLKQYYTNLGFSMKDTFDAYVRSQGKDPEKVWRSAFEAIKEIALLKENHIKEAAKRFGNGRNFFELVRIDFALDEDLNVYTMEANMSPNLSSAHYPPNQLLYEQVIYNLFALVGVGRRIKKDSLKISSRVELEMMVADKNLVVLPELCAECEDCFRIECQLCSPCFTDETRLILSQSYLEHQNKMDFHRVFPPAITKNMVLMHYTLRNQLLARWFQGKCELDHSWCS
ncbi:probable tubulin polyglutamylase ttll-15 isoform X1 [Colletes gigas]|uniref:probable tubulin polyglutamylase ttll-15 isoform X1 n=1 Tax=Colletes gigas TaxID=935657 RepID=UPI001C9B8718|nr:probable tubulin polyglutamylase ttll-15 isoform X1 [Colletes gigas]XP_043255677.1 probable tubulin polyglutamylase ttll-15 isoform X1 [Colletes gigas]